MGSYIQVVSQQNKMKSGCRIWLSIITTMLMWLTNLLLQLISFTLLYIYNLPNLEYIESTSSDEIVNANANAGPDPNAPSAAPLFPRLESLVLWSLPKLKGWRTMCASSSSSKNGCFYRGAGVGATTFPRLKQLILKNLVGLEVVPEEFQGLSSLAYLRIENCNLLKGIPEWIEILASLEELDIMNCPELTSSPEQIVKLSNFDFERDPWPGEGEGEWLSGKRRGNGSTSSSNFHTI